MYKLNVKFERQYKPLFLKNGKGQQSLDFYLIDYNIAVECQGEQHFKPIDFAGKGEKWMNQLFEKLLRDYQIDERFKEPLKDQLLLTYQGLTSQDKEIVRTLKQNLRDVEAKLEKIE